MSREGAESHSEPPAPADESAETPLSATALKIMRVVGYYLVALGMAGIVAMVIQAALSDRLHVDLGAILAIIFGRGLLTFRNKYRVAALILSGLYLSAMGVFVVYALLVWGHFGEHAIPNDLSDVYWQGLSLPILVTLYAVPLIALMHPSLRSATGENDRPVGPSWRKVFAWILVPPALLAPAFFYLVQWRPVPEYASAGRVENRYGEQIARLRELAGLYAERGSMMNEYAVNEPRNARLFAAPGVVSAVSVVSVADKPYTDFHPKGFKPYPHPNSPVVYLASYTLDSDSAEGTKRLCVVYEGTASGKAEHDVRYSLAISLEVLKGSAAQPEP